MHPSDEQAADRSGDRVAGLSEAEMAENVVRLVFGGDRERFAEFCRVMAESLPSDTAAVLRGSAVTGHRWEDGAPFDADGPGSSDLDVTLVGGRVLDWFLPEDGFYIPQVHSKPLSERAPHIAPELE